MKCTGISFLDSFYKSSYGSSLSAKVSALLLHEHNFNGNMVAYGYGQPYMNQIEHDKLYFAIPEFYPIYRWPEIRPFKTVLMNAESQPFRSSVFDVAILFHVLEFCCKDSYSKFLEEIRRILKPNGILMVIAINGRGLTCMLNGRKNVKCDIDEISTALVNNNFEIKSVTGENGNLDLWPANISYIITKYSDSLAKNLPSLADVVVIKAKKMDFASEPIEVFVPQYGV